MNDAHQMQCSNYLKATGLPRCLLCNFGKPRLNIKRVVPEAGEPHETICVFCVHLLSSAFKFFLVLRHRSTGRTVLLLDSSLMPEAKTWLFEHDMAPIRDKPIGAPS